MAGDGRRRGGQFTLDCRVVLHQRIFALEVQPIFEHSGKKLTVTRPRGTSLSADSRALRQLLLNQLPNADRFTDRGRVEMRVDHDTNGALRFCTSDKDIGRSDAQQARTFEPFIQDAQV